MFGGHFVHQCTSIPEMRRHTICLHFKSGNGLVTDNELSHCDRNWKGLMERFEDHPVLMSMM
jgi:hypothetical protein